MQPNLQIVVGDITTFRGDAIVNAANSSLLGGGGVDGAIHAAAGVELLAECRGLGGCKTGEAKITNGYGLLARHVIHTVGPLWHGGDRAEDVLLASCYKASMNIAIDHSFASIAFPAISTGIYRFPIERAAKIAVGTVADCLDGTKNNLVVVFYCFSASMADIYRQIIENTGRLSS